MSRRWEEQRDDAQMWYVGAVAGFVSCSEVLLCQGCLRTWVLSLVLRDWCWRALT